MPATGDIYLKRPVVRVKAFRFGADNFNEGVRFLLANVAGIRKITPGAEFVAVVDPEGKLTLMSPAEFDETFEPPPGPETEGDA